MILVKTFIVQTVDNKPPEPIELFTVEVPDEFQIAHSEYVLKLNEQSGRFRGW